MVLMSFHKDVFTLMCTVLSFKYF